MSEAPAVKPRRRAPQVARQFICPGCEWPYPIVLSQLSEQTREPDGSIKSELAGFLNRCPMCELLYSNTPLGQRRLSPTVPQQREQRRLPPPEEPPRVRDDPRPPWVEVPADQLKQWETGEPGGPG